MENKIGMALQEGGFVRIYDENGSYTNGLQINPKSGKRFTVLIPTQILGRTLGRVEDSNSYNSLKNNKNHNSWFELQKNTAILTI